MKKTEIANIHNLNLFYSSNALQLQMIDIKQTNKINDIESYFGIKGLKDENFETKVKC